MRIRILLLIQGFEQATTGLQTLHSSIVSVHGPFIGLLFVPPQHLSFDYDADSDRAFDFDADPAFHADPDMASH